MADDFSLCMVSNTRMAARAITRRYDGYLRPYGLSATQFSLLGGVSEMAGATVSEIAVAGKPSILVPLKIAMDDHQRFNAKLLADVGAAEVASEDVLSVDVMAGALYTLLSSPERMARMAAAARSVAKPRAAEALADMVEQIAR